MKKAADLHVGRIVCTVEEDPSTRSKIYKLWTRPKEFFSMKPFQKMTFPEISFSAEFLSLTKYISLPGLFSRQIRISPFSPNESNFNGIIKLVQDTPDTYKTLLDGNPWSDINLMNTFSRYYQGVCATLTSLKALKESGKIFPWDPDFDMCYVIYERDRHGAENFIGRCGFRSEKECRPFGTQVYYALSPSFWGYGLGKEIGVFLKEQWDRIFNMSGAGRLRGTVQSGRNRASSKILEAMGMRQKIGLNGKPYQIPMSEWNNALYSIWEYPLAPGYEEQVAFHRLKEERINGCANESFFHRSMVR